ncbi:MAG: phospholipid carrier-dependent glycosyltransferase [Anaerolineales bacterium]|nr:phospholipid carrier-dependent glycosyltransferase [Anaerolineales bacterium]
MMMTKSRLASFSTLGLFALAGTFLVLYATPQGLGLFDDSIAYIAGARSLLAGQGYRAAWLASNKFVTHFPPAFSALLAFVGLSGLDPLRGTRFVNSLLFGGNIFLLGLSTWRMTKSQLAGVAAALLLLINPALFYVHTTAMSEPLYLFLTLAAFLVFSQYADGASKRPVNFLILAAVLSAGAYLARYAGLALFAALLVALLILHDTWKKRLIYAAVYFAAFLPFALAWALRNRLLTDNATNRSLLYHPIAESNLQLGISNVAAFLLPIDEWRKALDQIPNFFPTLIIVLILALFAWTIFKTWRKFFNPASPAPETLSFVNALYFFAYLASILASMTFFDASTKFQIRILAPLYLSLIALAVYFICQLLQSARNHVRFIIYLIALCAVAFSLYGLNAEVVHLRKGGQGYASFQWFDSDAIQFLRGLPAETRIYSNEVAAVYLYTGRGGYVLPDLVDPVTNLPRGRFDEGAAALQADVLSGDAALALFDVAQRGEAEQAVYQTLTENLRLAFKGQGDKIYTAFP